ncbi:hypothetical protein F4804DRAFT_324639 [Jackrogersella minutella]|nr:hypothetical protein F4804DRAFT_324639 [Jackrogersella minutella]
MGNSSLEDEPSDSGCAETSRGAKSGSSRPSFTDYWKRTKRAAKHITFVSSSHEQAAGPSKDDQLSNNDNHQQGQSDLDSQAKAQARRAQVRKAQIQHRQRKANYTKELEMDVAKLRDLIEQTERLSLVLRTENEAIRRRLPVAAPSSNIDFSFSQAPTIPAYSVPEYTVSLLAGSESLNTPLYQVERTPTLFTPSPSGILTGYESLDAECIPGMAPGTTLSDAQTDHAINFILGLEHICWNHFHPSYYAHNEYDPEGKENGHMLMASAIALHGAPAGAWEQISGEKERRKQGPSCAPAPPPTATPCSHISPSAHTHNTTTTLTSWPLPAPAPAHPGLTLDNLFGLASTLNPADGAELAPVQAWFEIARVYGGAVVQDPALMDRVRAELARDVDCLHFGAVIQRAAFVGAVERVLGPVPGV